MEFASDSNSISEYYDRVMTTYGEGQIKEALNVYENYRISQLWKAKYHEPILTLRFINRLMPSRAPFKISLQNAILVTQMVLLALSVIYPPFNFELPGGAVSNAGYHFISAPPHTQHVTLDPTQRYEITGRVDVVLLAIEWALIFAFGFAARKLTLKRNTS